MPSKLPLYLVDKKGSLIRMNPSAPATEDELQELIATHPALISGEEDRLLLIEREYGIADESEGSARWSLDHLYVTQTGIPVLVEVKRAVDTRLRREVVGQMMDYAANAVAYWPSGTAEERFRESCSQRQIDPDVELSNFLGEEMSADAFWRQVDTNFLAAKVKLVFVADQIPAELARIVEFLNDQMKAEVRAIELTYFEGEGVRTLAPRVIGETERSRMQKSGSRPKLAPVTLDQWIAGNITQHGANAIAGSQVFLDLLRNTGAEFDVASTQGSIYSRVQTTTGKNCYPMFLTKAGKVQLGFGWITASEALDSEEARFAFYERFRDAVGDLSNENFKTGFPSFPVERLVDTALVDRLRPVVGEFVAACKIGKSAQ